MVKAFELERSRRLPWHSDKWVSRERYYEDIESETIHARDRFNFPGAHLDNEVHNREYWLSVITEEIGKLCQTVNKLQITRDEQVRQQWILEGYHRILTASSLLRRLAEFWRNLPTKGGENEN